MPAPVQDDTTSALFGDVAEKAKIDLPQRVFSLWQEKYAPAVPVAPKEPEFITENLVKEAMEFSFRRSNAGPMKELEKPGAGTIRDRDNGLIRIP